jgi:hypothetical protein
VNQKNTDNIGLSLRLLGLAICGAWITHAWAVEENKSAFPGTDAGARSLLQEFAKPDADCAALSKNLRPTPTDYAAVFESDVAAKVAAVYNPVWDSGELVIEPNPGQTRLRISFATTDDLRTWTGTAMQFPGGWKKIGPKLKPGFKIYQFEFVEPGKSDGMAYDGLIYVNGNWRIFPKAWRALEKQT